MQSTALEQFQGLIHAASGPERAAPVVYLPGVHGDPSRLGDFRPLLAAEHRLIEVTYPHAATWDLARYAAALEDLLDVLDLPSAHLVAESFGSLVAWEFALTRPARVRSISAVAGFCCPPMTGTLALARRALELLPSPFITAGLDLYDSVRGAVFPDVDPLDRDFMPFYAVRSDRARRAVARRLEIIESADFRTALRSVAVPVGYVGGSEDRIVPVRKEAASLARSLPREARFAAEIIPGGPHQILASHPWFCANFVGRQIARAEEAPKSSPQGYSSLIR